jgi:hypothetical protein
MIQVMGSFFYFIQLLSISKKKKKKLLTTSRKAHTTSSHNQTGRVARKTTRSIMFVIKRDGREEPVHFDKITARINKLAYGLNQVRPSMIKRKRKRGDE